MTDARGREPPVDLAEMAILNAARKSPDEVAKSLAALLEAA